MKAYTTAANGVHLTFGSHQCNRESNFGTKERNEFVYCKRAANTRVCEAKIEKKNTKTNEKCMFHMSDHVRHLSTFPFKSHKLKRIAIALLSWCWLDVLNSTCLKSK